MTQTQLKLKEYFDELLNETSHTARYGDHSSHSGYFNLENGCGEPPYTGEGIGAMQELEEWEEFMKDPLAMFDWDCLFVMPELAQQAFEKWVDLHEMSMTYVQLQPVILVALIEKFVKDFYQVATGHDFEVVQI
jgi:hypothetical protein